MNISSLCLPLNRAPYALVQSVSDCGGRDGGGLVLKPPSRPTRSLALHLNSSLRLNIKQLARNQTEMHILYCFCYLQIFSILFQLQL